MRKGSRHLGYCTNVHPGETLDDLRRILQDDVARVKARVSPGAPFGVGLRLGNEAANELAASAVARGDLATLLSALDLYVFTVNAFPYGDFAARTVKAAVYEPGWLEPERVDYTRRVADALAAMPGPMERTVSTVAGGYKPTYAGREADVARNLERAARHLAELADRTGVVVRLCLEPEPWTMLETTEDAVRFFVDHVLPLGEHARRHLGLCYDCCHQAVVFEDAAAGLGRLRDAGVVVGKIQVSSALEVSAPGTVDARALLRPFAEPRYLHQVFGRHADGGLVAVQDLPQLVDGPPDPAWDLALAWRCHFHVPIGWQGAGALRTTRAAWEAAVRASECAHLEVETYTWHVLPPGARGGSVHEDVASELEVLLQVLAVDG